MKGLFRDVLVPYDFSPHSARALRLAFELARRDRGRVTVLHVVPLLSRVVGVPSAPFPPVDLSAGLVERQLRWLGRHLERARRGRRTPPVECRVVVGDPFRMIIRAVRPATVIVIGTLGLSGMPRLVLGSVAAKVVRHAAVPVLSVRPGSRLGRRRRRVRSHR